VLQTFKDAASATALIGVSFYLWRIAYNSSDWAVLALLPLALVVFVGFWPLMLAPWKARLKVILRETSPLSQILTGKIRATLLSVAFTLVTIIVLAWQALSATLAVNAIMLAAVFASGFIFSVGQRLLVRHFYQPFARVIATNLVTWVVALPLMLIIAITTWGWSPIHNTMLDANFLEALQIGMENLPTRRGWISEVLAVPYAFESAKFWAIIQIKNYPQVATLFSALFSLDAALYSFILCRVSIVVTQFVENNVSKEIE